MQGGLFRAFTMTQRRRANCFVHKARQRGDIETNNTTAHPQQGNAETGITSAPDNCTKNTHFSPAKAMAVSTPHRYKRAKVTTVSVTARPAPAKATTVSDNRTPGLLSQAATPRHDSHGRRRGQATVRVSGGGAWPGFETTRRAKLAARTARGRAAAHGHTKQPGRDSGTSPGHPNPITHTLARALSPGLAHRRKRPPL